MRIVFQCVLAAGVVVAAAIVSAETIHLQCNLTQAQTRYESPGPISESENWVLHMDEGKMVKVTVPFECDPETSKLTVGASVVRAECYSQPATLNGRKIHFVASIDRNTGEYLRSLEWPFGGVSAWGICRVDKR